MKNTVLRPGNCDELRTACSRVEYVPRLMAAAWARTVLARDRTASTFDSGSPPSSYAANMAVTSLSHWLISKASYSDIGGGRGSLADFSRVKLSRATAARKTTLSSVN